MFFDRWAVSDQPIPAICIFKLLQLVCNCFAESGFIQSRKRQAVDRNHFGARLNEMKPFVWHSDGGGSVGYVIFRKKFCMSFGMRNQIVLFCPIELFGLSFIGNKTFIENASVIFVQKVEVFHHFC